jgi:hypothetical protein
LGEAFTHVLSQQDAQCHYSCDDLAENDNNAAKHARRAVHPGKKIYILDGEPAALLYGLIGTCRLNSIDPKACVLPEWPSSQVAELLPRDIDLINT